MAGLLTEKLLTRAIQIALRRVLVTPTAVEEGVVWAPEARAMQLLWHEPA
jgi:hypothetical protein